MKTLLVNALDQAFNRRSWHGPNLMGSLRGVSPEMAAKSIAGRKTIWEQLLHAAYWKHRVLSRLTIGGRLRFPRRGSNWPIMPADRTAAAWKADLTLIREIHTRLRQVVLDTPKSKLIPRTIWLIQGAAAHDLYHTGQIKLLQRLLETGKNR